MSEPEGRAAGGQATASQLSAGPDTLGTREQIEAVISLAEATIVWVTGLAGMARSVAICACESPPSTAGE